MNYRLNSDTLSEIFAVPAAVVDDHIKLAGSAQLKVLLWLLRSCKGVFDPELCSKAIGLTPADCSDALQYWLTTGVLQTTENVSSAGLLDKPCATPTAPQKAETPASSQPAPVKPSRPRPVKPQMKEVIARQKESPEFSYLLDTASSRLGRAISQGDMETLLYLFETAGLPVEVILMVIEYAIAQGKYHMRYIEKVALDWADRGITTIAAAEEFLCAIEKRRQAWQKVSALLGLTQSPTIAQSDDAERWISQWQMDDALIRLAYERCVKGTGKFNSSYMSKILEQWHSEGIDTMEKALSSLDKPRKGRGKDKAAKDTSFDLTEYEKLVNNYTPVYTNRNE